MNTNKIDLIKEAVEKLKSNLMYGACSSQVAMETYCKEEAYNEVLAILDTMQEEPISKELEEVIEWIDSHWREYVNVDADGVVCFGHWKNDLRKAMQDKILKIKERKEK